MKLATRKEKILIFISIIGGLLFASYVIFEQRGHFGRSEIIPIIITGIIGLIIAIFIIKKANQ